MDNLISIIRKSFGIRQLDLMERFRYLAEIVRFGEKRPDESGRTSLFGFNIHYDRFDSLTNLIREIFINLSYLCYMETDSPVIFDIGSNIGITTLFFKKLYPDSKIYCFEPDPDTFSYLEKNIKGNNLKDVFTMNAGLSDYHGSAILYVPSWSSGSSSVYQEKVDIEKGFADEILSVEKSVREKRVDLIRCSQFIEEQGIKHIDLMKIDAEGAEERIIEDLKPLLNMIDLLIFEYHYAKEFIPRDSLGHIISNLEKAEFIVFLEPVWMVKKPQVLCTYLVRAINGRSVYINKDPFGENIR